MKEKAKWGLERYLFNPIWLINVEINLVTFLQPDNNFCPILKTIGRNDIPPY